MWYLITVIRKAKFASYDQLITGVCGILAFSNSLKWIVMKNYIRFAIWTDKIKFCWFFFFSKCSCFLCKLVLFKVLALHVFVVVFFCIYLHHLKFQFGFLIAVQKRSPRGVAVSQSYRPFSPAAIWHTSCCRWEPGSAAVSHAQFPVRNFKLYFELQFKSKSLCQEFSNTPFGVEYWTNSQSPNS